MHDQDDGLEPSIVSHSFLKSLTQLPDLTFLDLLINFVVDTKILQGIIDMISSKKFLKNCSLIMGVYLFREFMGINFSVFRIETFEYCDIQLPI